jgi:hypothetical protein
MSEQKPSVGRVVHYVSHGSPVHEDGTQAYKSECRAAIVTETDTSDTVGLCVLNPTGQFFDRTVVHDGGDRASEHVYSWSCDGRSHVGGTWHWPARA